MATSSGVGIQVQPNIATLDVDGALLRKGWAAKTYIESLQQEPLLQNANIMETIKVGKSPEALPTASIIDVSADSASKSARSVTLQFLRALDDTGGTGNASTPLGSEETLRLKAASFYSNDWFHAVTSEQYGIDFRELSPTKIYSQLPALLKQWRGELEGYYLRSAIIETRSPNLTSAPTSLAQPLNPNWYVPGATTQPTYDSTASDHEDNIGDVLSAVTSTNCKLTPSRILALGDYLEESYIKPTMVNGMPVYRLYLSADEIRYNLDPSQTGSWAAYFNTSSACKEVNDVIPGSIGMIGDKIVCIRDVRCPTLTMSGTSADWTATVGYMMQGRNDGRTTGRTANTHFNLNYVLGGTAIGKYVSEADHFEEQKDQYDKIKAIAYIGAFGYCLVNWDVDTATDASMQSEGTFVIPTQR